MQLGGISSADAITCPAYNCKYIIDQITVASLIDLSLYKKYLTFILKLPSFSSENIYKIVVSCFQAIEHNQIEIAKLFLFSDIINLFPVTRYHFLI